MEGSGTNTAGGFGFRTVIGTAADDEFCVAGNIEDASATTDTECGIHDSGFLNEDDGTTGYEMDLDAFNSGGWGDNFVNVMGNAKKTICLIMGQDDAVSGRIMSSLVGAGGMAGAGGIAGSGGGLAG